MRRNSRTSARSSRRHAGRRFRGEADSRNRLGYALIAGSALVCAALGFAAARPTVQIDPVNGCPVGNRTPQAHTIILVDETDRLSPDDLHYLRSVIKTEYLWLPKHGRLTIRNIVADPEKAEDTVICRISDGSDIKGVLVNKRKVQQDFDRTAGARLKALSAELASAPQEPYSPILEFIGRVMERADFGANVKARRLVVVSDFAQHSPLVSHYERFRSDLPDYVEDQLHHDMSGVEVRLHYISRAKLRMQGERHKAFWTGHLETMGAHAVLGRSLVIGETPDKETWIDAPA